MAKLTFGKLYQYNRSVLKNYGTDELAAEYNRLRKLANKRLETMGRSEFSESQTYMRNRGKYNKTAREMGRTELIDALSAVGHFVGAKTGSVRGLQHQRNVSIETLHEHGYTFVNKKNFKAFTEYMEKVRDENPKAAGSPTAEDLKNKIAPGKKRVSPREAEEYFNKYLEDHGLSDLL